MTNPAAIDELDAAILAIAALFDRLAGEPGDVCTKRKECAAGDDPRLRPAPLWPETEDV